MRAARPAVAGLLAAAAAAPALAPAQSAERPRIAIAPRAVVYGDAAQVDARLLGGRADAGIAVALLERRLPGDGRYREIHRTRADAEGAVRFELRPTGNAYYAVRSRSEPVQTSLGLLVRVRPRIEVAVSDPRPRRRTRVTFSGTIAPAVHGAQVTVQRRGERRWRTVGTTTARAGVDPAPPGPAGPSGDGEQPARQVPSGDLSGYEVTFRARRSGRYRVVVAATEGLSEGASASQRLRVTRRAKG